MMDMLSQLQFYASFHADSNVNYAFMQARHAINQGVRTFRTVGITVAIYATFIQESGVLKLSVKIFKCLYKYNKNHFVR